MFIHKQFFPYTNFLDYFGFQAEAMRRSADSFLCFDWSENGLVVYDKQFNELNTQKILHHVSYLHNKFAGPVSMDTWTALLFLSCFHIL